MNLIILIILQNSLCSAILPDTQEQMDAVSATIAVYAPNAAVHIAHTDLEPWAQIFEYSYTVKGISYSCTDRVEL
jgi:uncharacterized phage-associated protein